jgi:hypothetical protein
MGFAPLGEQWIEEVGEADLIGGWAEVMLPEDFAKLIDSDHYQVFLTSYGPATLFVQNRTARGFEIHALSTRRTKRAFSTSCSYRVIGHRRPQ